MGGWIVASIVPGPVQSCSPASGELRCTVSSPPTKKSAIAFFFVPSFCLPAPGFTSSLTA